MAAVFVWPDTDIDVGHDSSVRFFERTTVCTGNGVASANAWIQSMPRRSANLRGKTTWLPAPTAVEMFVTIDSKHTRSNPSLLFSFEGRHLYADSLDAWIYEVLAVGKEHRDAPWLPDSRSTSTDAASPDSMPEQISRCNIDDEYISPVFAIASPISRNELRVSP